jgi:hypothetical protein
MRVTPVRPIAPTARTLARRTPTLPQRNLSNDRDTRSDPDHRKLSNSRCPSGNGVYIDLEV